MNFEFKPKLTEEFIFSKVSEETVMGFYLKVPIKKGLFRSPLRDDKNPTCSLYRNKSGKLIFKDFATQQYLTGVNVVMELYSCTYYEALGIIANDFGLIPNKNIPKHSGKIDYNPIKIEDKEISKIQIEIQEFTELELAWWKKYGITLDILKKFEVYSCKHVFLNGHLFAKSQQHCPIFGYYGGKVKQFNEKIELWRCYFPKRKTFRFITNWPSKKIQGYKQLPKKGKILVITKSMKDVMCLYSLGISAIAPCSETMFIKDEVLKELRDRFEHIFVLFDLDHTGIQFSKKIKKEHPELVVTLLPRTDGCKDVSDYYKKFERQKTIEMIKKKLELYKTTINE